MKRLLILLIIAAAGLAAFSTSKHSQAKKSLFCSVCLALTCNGSQWCFTHTPLLARGRCTVDMPTTGSCGRPVTECGGFRCSLHGGVQPPNPGKDPSLP